MTQRPTVCTVRGGDGVRPNRRDPASRLRDFQEAEQTFSPEQAVAEARRCAASSPCLYCDVCQLLCPDLAITRDPETGRIIIDLDFCKGCGLCARYCPKGAIEMVIDE